MARPRVHVFFGLVSISWVYLELAALAGRPAHVSAYQLIIITCSLPLNCGAELQVTLDR